MPPLPKPTTEHYDVVVIGGGSGGAGMSRRAASYGAKVLVVEETGRLGGTCVNVGCVPKKLMWHAADISEALKAAPEYGFGESSNTPPKFNWKYFAEKRDAYVRRLNGIYDRNFEKDKVEYIAAHAKLVGDKNVELSVLGEDGKFSAGTHTVSADHIVIATGGRPTKPSEEDIPGAHLGIDSDGFFALREQPKRVAVVGAGYIAVELAGVFNTLGSETHLLIRSDSFLRSFDSLLGGTLQDYMGETGLNVHKRTNVKKVTGKEGGPLTLELDTGKTLEVDCLLWAIGRHPNVENLGLETVGVKQAKDASIEVDKYQNTNVPGIYALGDIAGKALLTPVAIAAGRRLSNRLFGGSEFKDDHLNYDNIPTAIFSHPPCGSVGLSEKEAVEKYGKDNVFVYQSRFVNMYYGMLEHKQPTIYKLVVTGKEETVVGAHLIGLASDELIQAIGILVKLGATKKNFE